MPSDILDWTGRPMASFSGAGSGNLYARTPDDNRLRPAPRNHFDDYIALLGSWNWRSLVSEARGVSTRGLIAGALLQKAEYLGASDWRTYYPGEDSEYGDQVESLLEDTSHLCCTRGPRYDWDTFWTLMFLAAEVDGGAFIGLTGNADGWPLIQPFEAHRIGQRSADGMVKANSAITRITGDDGAISVINTPYVDLKICNGIIYNRAGAEVAYRVLGETAQEDQDISARDMIHVAPPRWFSEGRPLGKIVPGLMDIIAVGLARDAQLSQQIIDSKLTAIIKNATGKQDITRQLLMQGGIPNQTSAGTNAELVETAQFRYLKTGEEATPWQSQRPSDQWMNYDERMAASAINPFWRIEMLDPTALRGAATRAFQDQINTKIRSSFKPFKLPMQRVRRYQISKFTKIGMLPDHVDFLKCGVTQPPDFVVDRNSAIVDIAMVRAGADSMPNLLRRSGLRPEEVLNQQGRYLYQKAKAALKWSRDGVKISPDQLGTMAQRGDQSRIDEIGTAVRAGALTPSTEIEQTVRSALELPPMSPEVESAWKKDNGVKAPITLTQEKPDATVSAEDDNKD